MTSDLAHTNEEPSKAVADVHSDSNNETHPSGQVDRNQEGDWRHLMNHLRTLATRIVGLAFLLAFLAAEAAPYIHLR